MSRSIRLNSGFWLSIVLLTCAPSAQAQEGKARFYPTTVEANSKLTVAPLSFHGGSTVTLISPEQWTGMARRISDTLESLHRRFHSLFGEIPAQEVTVRLLDDESFYRTTGAPRWTNALFYRGEILLPIATKGKVDHEDLLRAVRHEYAHALVNALTGSRCPGWIDEGLAQWAEGETNPALYPALASWLKRREPVPFSLLQGGFTRLETTMVPAAYAQSLFTVNLMLDSFGVAKFKSYFETLRQGVERSEAFSKSFGHQEAKFEQGLAETLDEWRQRQ